MRAAGQPSFLQAKDSGRVAAARTLAQDVGRRTSGMDETVHSFNARRVRCMLGKTNEATALSLLSVHAYQNEPVSIYIYRSIY